MHSSREKVTPSLRSGESYSHYWSTAFQYTLRLLEMELSQLELDLGRPPEIEEVAAAMGLAEEQYGSILKDLYPVPLSGYRASHRGLQQETRQEEKEKSWDAIFVEHFTEAVRLLPELEQRVITLHYFDRLELYQISAELGIPEATIRQLHSQGMIRLRVQMGEAWRLAQLAENASAVKRLFPCRAGERSRWKTHR